MILQFRPYIYTFILWLCLSLLSPSRCDSDRFLQSQKKYKPEEFKNLTYYVIPHSHTDAGWWLTFNVYYHNRARSILTTVFNYLNTKYNQQD